MNSYTKMLSCSTLFRGTTIGGLGSKFGPRRLDELLLLRARVGSVVRRRV